MADPNFVYRPRTMEQRQAQSLAARLRLGIANGFVRIYGSEVPEEFAYSIRKYAHSLACEYGSDAAREFMCELAARLFETEGEEPLPTMMEELWASIAA